MNEQFARASKRAREIQDLQARIRELEGIMQEIADLRGEDVAIARTAVRIAEAALAGRREEDDE
jgi:hypothetical protein